MAGGGDAQVRSCVTDATTKFDKGIPPCCIDPEVSREMPEHSRKIILNQKLYTMALRANDNAKAFGQVMAHWAWEWADYSKSVTTVVYRGLTQVRTLWWLCASGRLPQPSMRCVTG